MGNVRKLVDGETDYYVDNEANIISTKWGKERILKPWLCNNGYLMVSLQPSRLVHRIVAIAFVPNPENKPFVDHIDEDKLNNHPSNLQWLTNRENLAKSAIENPRGQAKKVLSAEDVWDMRFGHHGQGGRQLAEHYGVTQPNVSAILNFKSWKHVTEDYF